MVNPSPRTFVHISRPLIMYSHFLYIQILDTDDWLDLISCRHKLVKTTSHLVSSALTMTTVTYFLNIVKPEHKLRAGIDFTSPR